MREQCARVVLTLLVLALLGAGTLGAQESDDKTPPADEAAAATSPIAGLRVVIDPETGRLRAPPADETRQLALPRPGSAAADSLKVEESKDGTLTVRLGGLFLKAAAARVTADGEVAVQHDAVPAVPAPGDAAEDSDEEEKP